MRARGISLAVLLAVAPVAGVSLMGCHAHSASAATPQQKADQRAELEDQREQLQQIPVSSKDRYMAIHSFESWENPYLTVQANMVELHVTRADSNPSTIGVGGMFRPEAARRVELNIADGQLGDAVAAIPADAWPYGRVVAVEEAHHTPANAEPMVRRNLEKTIALLNDLGVQVYDPTEGKLE
ncbi:hypothetical protein GOB94_10895 [Granulicella sp. 5B5]|nr:hypothetical protein GOB94_10895 [Granulicella sp. 5B5]